MSFFKTIEKRRSSRSFSKKAVEKSKISKILKAAWMSPSSMGTQNYQVYEVVSASKKEKLVKATHDQGYVDAPLVLVFCTDPKRIKDMGARGKNLFAVQDATIAAAYAQLAATAQGLSSVWIGHFKEKAVAQTLKTKLRPVAILAIGYSTEKPGPKEFQKMKDLFKKV
ncbi:nitroreductase family protein [Nitrosopumilus sp. K4]|uniref:nitroreductase family protein n=1 Tax=Nitrosopumilus sp. K4 TaxID=2795383 RepID=UPI001BA45A29|nr:nitroreductase family protein [Nitrosopumilus sp. K4]QUC64150.1 nitroreductase family protein [Nitrosopumilus sp. K4]